MISGIEFSDSSFIYNTQCSSQQGSSLMSINWLKDKEDIVYIYNGISLGNQKEWNLAISNNVDGTRVYYAKQNKSVRER